MTTILFFQSTAKISWRRKLSGVLRAARENDWFVHVIERDADTVDIRQAIRTWRPIGCLVDRAMNSSNVPDRMFGSTPTVYLDQNPRKPSRCHSMLIHDSGAEARLAGEELLKLPCRSYAYLSTGRRYFWDEERCSAFTELVRAAGFKAHRMNPDTLLKDLAAFPTPIGLLAANDHTAVDAYHAAADLGLSIPKDLSIVGIDNDDMYCESVTPGLTSIEPDFEGAGYRLAKLLESEIALSERPGATRRKPIIESYGPLRLVCRGSSRTITHHDARVERALEYIRRHAYDPDISLNAIASEMRCSRKLATMSFRKATGHSMLDEIHTLRFKRICEMLSCSSLSISEIVFASGYSSQTYPKRLFLARTGLTMRDWRKRHAPARV